LRVVVDVEANGLKPDIVWLIICKDIDTGNYEIFRNPSTNELERERFNAYAQNVRLWIGHNLLDYDRPVLTNLIGTTGSIDLVDNCLDTLIVSKLVDYSRTQGHSVEAYGAEFGYEKGTFYKFTDKELHNSDSLLFRKLEEYCKRDVDITHKIYLKYLRIIKDTQWGPSISLEHKFQVLVNTLETNGFSFNTNNATKLLTKVTEELSTLDTLILKEFPSKLKLIREIHPRYTKHGTLSKSDFRFVKDGDLSEYNGGPFSRCEWVEFNPSSHTQLVKLLNSAGWSPTDKTQTHIDTERDLNRLRYSSRGQSVVDVAAERAILVNRLEELRTTGWKVSEHNLETLPNPDTFEDWLKHCRIKLLKGGERIRELITKKTLKESDRAPANVTIKIQDLLKTSNSVEITDCLLVNLSECVSNKTSLAKFVESEKLLWLITVTPQEIYADCSASFVTDTWVGLRDTETLQRRISMLRAARSLAKRILLESRRRTLTEWLSLVSPNDRIHGQFYGIGAWTHRMAHQKPNTANIPSEFKEDGSPKLLGKEMRQLWRAPRNRLLVGVDAEGIQLRIFAHYIDDAEFTDALVRGDKKRKTDPHSLNQRILGDVCKGRQAAKRFIYALLLGAGLPKLAAILGCSETQAREALDNLLKRYGGFAKIKQEAIPHDASRGYFVGLDGRKVLIPGDTVSSRKHLCMSGYLQNGEAIIMKSAAVKWHADKEMLEISKEYPWFFVDMVHDEWQTEVVNNMKIALKIAEIQANSLKLVGEELGLKCPLAGSFYNDDHEDYTIGTNWYQTH